MFDKATIEKTKMTFMRVLIEVDITKQNLILSILSMSMMNLEQPLTFEWKRGKCTKSNMLRHMNFKTGVKKAQRRNRTYYQ